MPSNKFPRLGRCPAFAKKTMREMRYGRDDGAETCKQTGGDGAR